MAANEEELLRGAVEDHADLNEQQLLGDADDSVATNGMLKVKREVEDDLDLYDAATEPSENTKDTSLLSTSSGQGISSAVPPPSIQTTASISNTSANFSAGTKKFCCYIGNMTWWTTDEDIQAAVSAIGTHDLCDLKFHENRTNGQSKGFCLAVFYSEQSVRLLTEKLPMKPVHGQILVVLPYSKISLARLEEATARIGSRPDKKDKKDEVPNCVNMGTIRIGANGISPVNPPAGIAGVPPGGPAMMGGPPGGPMMAGGPPGGPMMSAAGPMGGMMRPGMAGPPMQLMMGGAAPPGMRPPGMAMPAMSAAPMQMGAGRGMAGQGMVAGGMPQLNRPPPSFGPPQGVGMGAPVSGPPQPLMSRPMTGVPGTNLPPPGSHVNPHVYPAFQASGDGSGGSGGPPLTESELEEVLNQNKMIMSSAIARAVSDASNGNHTSAMETLLTAISLIKHSRASGDERCKLLISSLHDTLSGIEAKMGSSRKHGSSRRDRSRSRSPRERKRHRRGGSRSRSRSRSPRRKY